MPAAPPLFNLLLPYLVAGFLAMIPALVEVLTAYGRRVVFLVRSWAGWAILFINVAFGLIAFVAVKFLFDAGNDLVTAAVVGLTFPTLLRTPLTLFKTVPATDAPAREVALRVLADLYEQLLRVARQEADIIQSDERTRLSVLLADKHGALALAHQIRWRIDALVDLNIQAQRRQELDMALAIVDERDRAVAVARVALDVVPRSTIREWLRRKKPLGN